MNKIGFGFLRLPLLDPKNDQTTDYEELNKMVDAFLASGQNYFDTAWTYMDGESENAIRKALVERHPRESFRLADKLPGYMAKSEADSERFFRESLERTGAGYFDVYLVHGVDSESYERSKRMHHFDAAAAEALDKDHPVLVQPGDEGNELLKDFIDVRPGTS
ncbi:MAG: aldo/keto reductase, partial [Firmicutes bacterium]|nr:aldo/keto reductase [Bacillota bacterium]